MNSNFQQVDGFSVSINDETSTSEVWGKKITIIGSTTDGDIYRKNHVYPYQQKVTDQTSEDVNRELEDKNYLLVQQIRDLQEQLETSQKMVKEDKEILPYFYNVNYATEDSYTWINRGEWKIRVWLAGRGPSELVLLPLGDQKTGRIDISPIKNVTFTLTTDDGEFGKAFAKTTINKNRAVIRFTRIIKSDGTEIEQSDVPLPILFESI